MQQSTETTCRSALLGLRPCGRKQALSEESALVAQATGTGNLSNPRGRHELNDIPLCQNLEDIFCELIIGVRVPNIEGSGDGVRILSVARSVETWACCEVDMSRCPTACDYTEAFCRLRRFWSLSGKSC